MRWMQSWIRLLSMAMLPVLVTGCCGAKRVSEPARVPDPPVVPVPAACSRADRIPAWRVDPTTLLPDRVISDVDALWQRIDDLEAHASAVRASCGTGRRDPAESSNRGSTRAP